MRKDGFWKVFLEYLRQHRKAFLIFFLFAAICAGVFFLYRLETEAVAYAAALCLAAGAAFCGADFWGYWRRHEQMRAAREKILCGGELPKARNLEQKDYEALLLLLLEERARLVTEADREREEMMDYFTLWAHQVKTPIAAAQLLLSEEDTELSREIGAQIFQISRYADMVLSYLKLSGETTDFVFGRYSLEELTRKEVRRYAPLFVKKRLKLNFSPMEAEVLTDQKWLRFVIGQILSNALKYTPKGEISIRAEGKTLIIADTGIGIAEEDLPRLGEKGFTGINGRKDQKATGLGLYLCRKILDKLGHSMEIRSAPGEGTEVRIGLQENQVQAE